MERGGRYYWLSMFVEDAAVRCILSCILGLCACSEKDARGWIDRVHDVLRPSLWTESGLSPRALVLSMHPAMKGLIESAPSGAGVDLLVTRVVVSRGLCLYGDLDPELKEADDALLAVVERTGAELVLKQIDVSPYLVGLVARSCPSLRVLRLHGHSRTCRNLEWHLKRGYLVEGGCTRCAYKGGELVLDAVCSGAWASLQEFDARDHGLYTVYQDRLQDLRYDPAHQ